MNWRKTKFLFEFFRWKIMIYVFTQWWLHCNWPLTMKNTEEWRFRQNICNSSWVDKVSRRSSLCGNCAVRRNTFLYIYFAREKKRPKRESLTWLRSKASSFIRLRFKLCVFSERMSASVPRRRSFAHPVKVKALTLRHICQRTLVSRACYAHT